MAYRFMNLTSAVGDKDSPLRRYLDARFPHTKPLQAEYREHAGPILVQPGTANPGTVGAAFDFAVRFTLDPAYDAELAAQAFAGHPNMLAVVRTVIASAQAAASRADADTLARACWACALTTDVYRRGGISPGSLLHALYREGRFNAPTLLAAAPPDGVRELTELASVAAEALLPNLSTVGLHLGPTFAGSLLCPADADLIAGGLLLDLKTRAGRKLASGERRDGLALADLYQVVAYVLFDQTDAYGLDSFGIYSARYGTFVSWPLSSGLDTLAGEPVDLAAERRTVWRILETGRLPGSFAQPVSDHTAR